MLRRRTATWLLVGVLITIAFSAYSQTQQKIGKAELDDARAILVQVKDTIAQNYYDPAFHGYDLDARFKEADQKLGDVSSFEVAMSVIGSAVQGLADSHTHFIPPARNVVVHSGWRMEMFGRTCAISAVEPGSDAWKQGLRPGDVVVKVQDYEPTRSTFGGIRHLFSVLAPQEYYHFVVASPSQSARSVTTRSRLIIFPLTRMPGGVTNQELGRLLQGDGIARKPRAIDVNESLMIWKLPAFKVPESEIKRDVGAARKHKTLILDLRDNSGGGEDDLRWMIGSFFDHDITVGEMIERGKSEPLSAPSFGEQAFTGNLIVLVNSSSASAAEVFARSVQLEKRGVVIGDQTAGAVGRAKIFPLRQGTVSGVTYSMEVTVARLKMPDGADLEGKGVMPDVKAVPTPMALAKQVDPVLSAAAKQAGVQISPEEAGRMFPVVWPTY